MWKFNGKELNPDKLPTMEVVVAGIHVLGGRDADKNAVLSWDYGEYGSNVAYWHSFDPADEDGIILMPVREGMLSIPFGTGNHLFSPDGLQVEKAEILSVEDCWCIQDNCYNTDARPGAARIWEEAAMISLSMGNHDHEDDLCE